MKIIKSKTKLKEFKDSLQAKKSNFMPVFWAQMVNWANRLAKFSQKKAGFLKNEPEPPSEPPIVSSSSEQLFALFSKRQDVTDNKIAQLESRLLSMIKQEMLKYNDKIIQERGKLKKPKATKPSLAPSENQTIEQISVESSNELRTILENNGIFEQKSWLALWQGNPAPCDLAKRLVLNYPPLKGSIIEIYYDIGVWLKKASHKIDLIIPKLNDEFDYNQHEMVKQLQQKGLANRVQEVKRLGLVCDDSVLVKAQVVSS